MYNWQLPDWPHFQYDISSVEDELYAYSERVGKVGGLLQGTETKNQMEIIISGLIAEAVKSSEIEGEYISRKDVMSSIKNQLGLTEKPETVNDLRAQGIAELMLSVRNTFAEPLSENLLFDWHVKLMKGHPKVNAGQWRHHTEPMQIVSGTIGKETVHFEAPPSEQVPILMERFIRWFNDTSPHGSSPIRHALIRSAIAHLHFESIHPFEDGNGRIGRAISEKVLAQHAETWLPLSISRSIELNKKRYYQMLNRASYTLQIDEWLTYFATMLLDALDHTEKEIGFVLLKARFFETNAHQMHRRQLKVVKRMLDEGPEGFEGGINARKYGRMTDASKATATRDLRDLVRKGILISSGGGRSTAYQVNLKCKP